MNAPALDPDDLDRRTRLHAGCVPPDLVAYLLDHGHADTVRELALDGEWFCARARARFLGAEGRQDEARSVLAPYVATGWWTAVAEAAGLLGAWGRVAEALDLVRPRAEAGEHPALRDFALLLARAGRAEEAYELLRPHVTERLLAGPLVEVSAGLGRDEEVAALLADRIAPGRACAACGDTECGAPYVEPPDASALLAAVRERQGRTDEAVALLRAHGPGAGTVNGRDPLAGLLARLGRTAELRAYAAQEPGGNAERFLARWLEERGDVAGAVEVYRPSAAASSHAALRLAELLVRHGRGEEAIDVLAALPAARGGHSDCILDALCTLYVDRGRAEEGLARFAGIVDPPDCEEWDLLRMRAALLAACGRVDQAVAELRAHPEGGSTYAAEVVAGLLAGAGRPEEAVAVLDPGDPDLRKPLAELLMALGRIGEAVAVLRRPLPAPPPPTVYREAPPW
ncbi:tetratricopeptide repeat protein [Streptomyces sp. NPDC048383]|uniref:tetratricopeptide repeat protein n=1 Tax=Streptomyces sp. NPDC048383 TaxID=3155386 RepID=UPI00341FDD0F